jgi:hypothetical protein
MLESQKREAERWLNSTSNLLTNTATQESHAPLPIQLRVQELPASKSSGNKKVNIPRVF